MKIEVLFPEICNLYGELENIGYLKKSMPDIEVVETAITDEPLFVTEEPDLIYMGTMTESAQLLVIDKLSAYIERIEELIGRGVNFLITGNALEVFGKRIEDVDGTVVECMGFFDFVTKRDMMNSQFTHSYWEEGKVKADPLFITDRGPGLNPDISGEGIHANNFMATYVIGPLLVLNPPFAKYVLRQCGAADPELAFEEAAMDAYEARVAEYSDPGTGFYY